MTTDRVYGVDGNWYLHRVIHTQMFEPEDVAASQARRFLGMICKDAAAVGAKRLGVAFDGGKIFRYGVDPDYKANREKNADGTSAYDHLQFIKDYLGTAGIHVVHRKQYEADDVLCTWSHLHSNFVAGTKDKDGFQYIRPGCFLYDSSAKPEPVRIKDDYVLKKMGCAPEQCVDYQTLVGDRIDNIANLMDRDKVGRGLKTHGSIIKWAKADPVFRRWLMKHEDVVRRNRKLVRLVPDIAGVTEIPAIVWNDDPTITKGYHEYRKIAGSKTKGLF